MAILRFRIYWEDDDSVYRDIAVKHTQSFLDLHNTILKCFEFDNKHKATFYRSNDQWQRGREISLEKYDKNYKAAPLLMKETLIGSEVKSQNTKFIYEYYFTRNWHFMVQLINLDKAENKKLTYPSCIRTEGIAPSQYGTKGLVDSRLAEMEEKYDLQPSAFSDGFSKEGGDDDEVNDAEEETTPDENSEEF
ncbi:MAG: hypothetical protein IPJ81_04970 [Chitinophagaceae bacterium]|nr:hypothetical protein [Chitinophagaceae bacterium]